MKVIFVLGLPLLVVLLAWYFRDDLDRAFPWLKGWRTVVMNAIPAILIGGTELIGFLAGFTWDAIVSAQTAVFLALGFNVANIALRAMTNTPVGTKEPT